jgi:NAD+ synthase
MTARLSIALAQINPKVGDIPGNLALIRRARDAAAAQGADLVVTPELSITGYPPEDLVLKPSFLRASRAAVEELAADTGEGPGLIVGAPWCDDAEMTGPLRHHVTNAAFLLDGGQVAARCDKHELPNYSVFDEVRVFKPGPMPGPVAFRGLRLGIPICEDIWSPDVCECLQETGAEILIVPNGSPFERDKSQLRQQIAVARVTETGLPLIFVNQVGGQDELIFDGNSFVLDSACHLRTHLPAFQEEIAVTRWHKDSEDRWHCDEGLLVQPPSRAEEIYRALVRLPRRHPGPFGGHRFRTVRGSCRRCAGSGKSPLRHDALTLHLTGKPRGRIRPGCQSRPSPGRDLHR